jgi:cadmium resistance protein CadD (predicted permease)
MACVPDFHFLLTAFGLPALTSFSLAGLFAGFVITLRIAVNGTGSVDKNRAALYNFSRRVFMASVIITAITSFVSTNIDDIFVLMVLFSQTTRYKSVVIGQYCGIGLLFCISILGTLGVNFLPEKYIGFLGVLPILLGIRAWVTYKTQQEPKDERQNIKRGISRNDHNAVKTNNFWKKLIESVPKPQFLEQQPIKNAVLQPVRRKTARACSKITDFGTGLVDSELFKVTAISVANGADNIGIYIPVFNGYSWFDFMITIIVFAPLIALWCYMGNKIANYPLIKTKLQKYKNIFVPLLFIGLGIYIISRSGLMGFPAV